MVLHTHRGGNRKQRKRRWRRLRERDRRAEQRELASKENRKTEAAGGVKSNLFGEANP